MNSPFQQELAEHLEVMRSASDLEPMILKTSLHGLQCLRQGGKLLFCGNGGSAADSQHLAAEFVVRYRRERTAMPAIALTTDASIMTAAGNDYDFDRIFSRQVEALGNSGDMLVAISTSGTSRNIIEAAIAAKQKGLLVIAITGSKTSPLGDLADLHWKIPSTNTARIQECYMFLGHLLCELIENAWNQKEP